MQKGGISMKKNKALLVLNIIIFVILIACMVFNAAILVGAFDAKSDMNDPNNENNGAGLGLAILLVLQIYLIIPYAVCLIVTIVSLCCKYFNWLSIANTVMCGLGVIATVIMFLLP